MDLLMAPGGQPLTQTVPQFRTNVEGLPLNVMPKTQNDW
jgi:hypothetical protein